LARYFYATKASLLLNNSQLQPYFFDYDTLRQMAIAVAYVFSDITFISPALRYSQLTLSQYTMSLPFSLPLISFRFRRIAAIYC